MALLSKMLGEAFDSLPDDIKTKYKDIDLVDSTSYVKKTQYDAEIKKRDKDLEDLKDKYKDNPDLEAEIKRLKNENQTSAKNHQDELDRMKFDTKFEKVIEEHKVRNPKALKALMDMDKVKLVDDTFIGLEEQLNALKESDSYLFETEETETQGGTGSLGGGVFGDTKEKISVGTLLAKTKTDNSSKEAQDKFFN